MNPSLVAAAVVNDTPEFFLIASRCRNISGPLSPLPSAPGSSGYRIALGQVAPSRYLYHVVTALDADNVQSSSLVAEGSGDDERAFVDVVLRPTSPNGGVQVLVFSTL